ncbi:hypothetical protein CDL15_Pgr022896 [Punica granatum]|uniref:PPM-type phosphatase domain-containing protein n=1 Tax=Punica granatum TaxID=22663 RepID=A0A218X3K7_PUNGR|nr:hypothetical protein CDL15_Pgr022896 [Punica granatum]PKI65793.1 hypothetical protein CRG98_013865 [Punica granatum]
MEVVARYRTGQENSTKRPLPRKSHTILRGVIGEALGFKEPDRSDELARIQALGGRVICLNGARVEGILAMSRAIGDKYLKPYVTAEPETTILRRDPRDEFLIIASDGLWDVLTNELACEITSRCLQQGSPPPAIDLNSGPHPEEERGHALHPTSALAAALLTRLALGRKSLDNISVIVVDLKRS